MGDPLCLVHCELIPEGSTVYKEKYVDTLHHRWDAVRRSDLENWHETTRFFCKTIRMNIGCWRPKSLLPSII
jgi:hypothetical protein